MWSYAGQPGPQRSFKRETGTHELWTEKQHGLILNVLQWSYNDSWLWGLNRKSRETCLSQLSWTFRWEVIGSSLYFFLVPKSTRFPNRMDTEFEENRPPLLWNLLLCNFLLEVYLCFGFNIKMILYAPFLSNTLKCSISRGLFFSYSHFLSFQYHHIT